MTVNSRSNAQKTQKRGRPFAAGNPGRPKGSRNKTTVLAERLLHADIEGIVSAVVEAAKGGDMTAARIILDRLVPIRRGRPVKFELPDGTDAGGMAAAFSALIKSVSEGTLTTEEGASVAVLLEAHRKAVEMVELAERVTALEKANDNDK